MIADEGGNFALIEAARRATRPSSSPTNVARGRAVPGTMVGFRTPQFRRSVAGCGLRHACLARSRSSRCRRAPRCCRRLGAQPECFPHTARGARGQRVGGRVLPPARLCRDRAAQAVSAGPVRGRARHGAAAPPRGAEGLCSSVKQLTKLRDRPPVAGCDRASNFARRRPHQRTRRDAVGAPEVRGLPANRELLRRPGVVTACATCCDHVPGEEQTIRRDGSVMSP